MADRFSVSITIGGDLAVIQRDVLADLIIEGLSTEWDGPDFDTTQFTGDGPFAFYAHEVAWGRLDAWKALASTMR